MIIVMQRKLGWLLNICPRMIRYGSAFGCSIACMTMIVENPDTLKYLKGAH